MLPLDYACHLISVLLFLHHDYKFIEVENTITVDIQPSNHQCPCTYYDLSTTHSIKMFRRNRSRSVSPSLLSLSLTPFFNQLKRNLPIPATHLRLRWRPQPPKLTTDSPQYIVVTLTVILISRRSRTKRGGEMETHERLEGYICIYI